MISLWSVLLPLTFLLLVSLLEATQHGTHRAFCNQHEDCESQYFLICDGNGKCGCAYGAEWEEGKCRHRAKVQCILNENRCTKHSECIPLSTNYRDNTSAIDGICKCKNPSSFEPETGLCLPSSSKSLQAKKDSTLVGLCLFFLLKCIT